jgi:hypothetical protein
MKKRAGPWVFCGLLCSLGLGAQEASSPSPFVWRQIINNTFRVGEKIHYQIKYGGFVGGGITQEVVGVTPLSGRPTYHVVLEAKTNKTFDMVHKMRERHESWIDVESLSSIRFIENAQEGHYTKNTETWVDSPAGKLTHDYKTSKHSGHVVVDIPAFPQDPLSMVYYLRNVPLTVGSRYEIPYYSGDDLNLIHLEVQAMERVRVPAGLFLCYHVVPLPTEKENIKGSFEVWISSDANRVPVLIKTKLSVGSFMARMTSFSPGPGPAGK